MTERFFASAAMATLFSLTTTALLAAEAPGTMSADQGWSSIARCAQEDTERARHTCVDRVLRDAGLLTNEMHARQQRNAFGLQEKPASAPPPASAASKSSTPSAAATAPAANAATAANAAAPAVSKAPSAASTAVAPPSAASNPAPAASKANAPDTAANPESAPTDRLEVELTQVEKAVNGRLLVTTKDGAAWLQTESVTMPLPPVAGDHMSIRKGALGGYRCTVASTNLTYRCIRNR